MLLQCLFAFGAIITFSVIIEAPRKCLLVNGILGLAGWAIYLYTEQFTSVLMATFMSGLVLAIISHILARLLKTPVTTTLIPAILTIVPGAGMYQTVYYLFTSDTQQALSSLVGTIGAAGAIAIAIFIDKQSCWDSHDEISQIKHDLYPCRMSTAYIHHILKMLV